MQVNFKLMRPGLMKDFAGKWTVQPFTQDTLDGLYNQAKQPASAAPWHSLTSSVTKRESSMLLAAVSLLCGAGSHRPIALTCFVLLQGRKGW